MKKLIMTSVMTLSVIGAANASVYLNWDAYNPETNPNGMVHLDVSNPGAGAEHNFNLLQNAVNQNAAAFDGVHQVVRDWNELFFGEKGDMTDGLFWSYYRKDGGVQSRLAALSSVAVSDVSHGEVSVGGGYGYHNGQSAAAFGFAVGLTDNWSMNAGAGLSSADTTLRAGTNYKFKLF